MIGRVHTAKRTWPALQKDLSSALRDIHKTDHKTEKLDTQADAKSLKRSKA